MFKVCLIIPSLQLGGMERVMSELANFFSKKRGVDVHLILYGKRRTIFYSLSKDITIHKPKWTFDNNKRTFYSLKTMFWIRRKIKEIGPVSILSFGEYWNSFVLLALLGTNVPIFVSDRCQPDKGLGRFHELFRKWLYPRAAGVIAQTGKAKQIYEQKKLNKNIRVIGNPIRQIGSVRDSESFTKENIILTVGRLIDTKHHDRLIKVFNRIKTNKWKLIIVGGNAIKQDGMGRLKKLISDLKIEDSVKLTGTVTDVERYYFSSDIFAFTSSSEGFPNVIGEAMSAGLPVISYDCVAGPSDLITDGKTGFLIPLFKDDHFAEKLKCLMEDADLRERMGEKSRKEVTNFHVNSVAEQFYSFIS